MVDQLYNQAAYFLLRRLASIVARLKLNRVTLIETAGQRWYLKVRLWYAPLILCYAAHFSRPPFIVLTEADWLNWEPRLYQLFHGKGAIRLANGSLKLPALSGLVLTDLLKAQTISMETKRQAIRAALASLHDLHQHRIRYPHGTRQPFSHSDATARNVIYNPATGQAHWFDFETVHSPHRGRQWRCADDLRAFVCSTAACLPTAAYPRLVGCLLDTYPDPHILAVFYKMMLDRQKRLGLFHLAQTRLSYRQHKRLTHELTSLPANQPKICLV